MHNREDAEGDALALFDMTPVGVALKHGRAVWFWGTVDPRD